MKPRHKSRGLAAANLLAIWLIGASLSLYLAGFVLHLAATISFPYPIHFEDGPLLNAAINLAQGKNIYVANSSPPYISAIYTPLHYLVFVPIVALFGPNLAAIKLFCLLNTLLLALLIYHWVAWRTASREGAVIAAVALFTFFPVANWAAVAKADTLAVLFSIAGAYIVDRYHPRGLWLSALLLALAFFTKQTQVAAASAVCLYLLLYTPKLAIRYGILFGALVSIPFFTIDLLTNHGLFLHTIEYNLSQHQWLWRGKQILRTFLISYSGYLLIAASGGLAILKNGRIPLPLIYLATSFLSTVTVISDGADFNHYIEVVAVTSLLVGIAIGRTFQSNVSSLKLFVLVLLAIQIATRLPSVMPGIYMPWSYVPESEGRSAGIAEPPLWLNTPTHAVQATGSQIISELNAAPGQVLAELSAFAALVGKPIELDDPYIFASISRSNRWDQTPILEKLRNGDYDLLALLVDVRPADFHHTRLTDEMVEAIRSNYKLEKILAYPVLEGPRIFLYRPNDTVRGEHLPNDRR